MALSRRSGGPVGIGMRIPGRRTVIPLALGSLLLLFSALNMCSGTLSGEAAGDGTTLDAEVVSAREDVRSSQSREGNEIVRRSHFITLRFDAPGHGVIHQERRVDEYIWRRFKLATADSPMHTQVVYVSPKRWYEANEFQSLSRRESLALWVLPLFGLLLCGAGVVNLVLAARRRDRSQTPPALAEYMPPPIVYGDQMRQTPPPAEPDRETR